MEIKKTKQFSNLADKSNMAQVILDFPKQFRFGLEAARRVKIQGKFNGVLVCGMGGSSLPGDILSLWLGAHKRRFSLSVWRNYGLPYQASKDNLVISISYSGNTEETLSSYKEAVRKKLPVAVITSGGKLSELAKRNKTPMAKIPKGFQPRMALLYQFGALMKILKNCRLINDNLKDFLALESSLKPQSFQNKARRLAGKLKGKIPLIYASERLKILAKIWKIEFNETSKTPAFYNNFPELNHTEMVGYTKIKYQKSKIKNRAPYGSEGEKENKVLFSNNFYFIILRDLNDHPRIKKRMELTKRILEKQGLKGEIIDIKGSTFSEKIFSTILLGSWISYYLALEYNIDPTPVKLVEEFKLQLKKA